MTLSEQLINRVVGLPWKKGGRDPIEGFDCWGFFKWFYAEIVGIKLNYDIDLKPGDTKPIIKAFKIATESGEWFKIDVPKQFCAVALSMNSRIHHVGVWVDEGCLHATEGLGVVYNSMRHLKRNGYSKVEFYEWQTKKQ